MDSQLSLLSAGLWAATVMFSLPEFYFNLAECWSVGASSPSAGWMVMKCSAGATAPEGPKGKMDCLGKSAQWARGNSGGIAVKGQTLFHQSLGKFSKQI